MDKYIYKKSLSKITPLQVFVFLILTALFVRAFFSFNPSFDYLWYHFPISLALFGNTTYVLSGFELSMYEALPPIVHYFQGVLTWLTGSVTFGNSVNYLGFILVTISIYILRNKRLFGTYYALGFLSIPLFVAQLYSGFIDVWSNLWLFLAFVSYIDMVEKKANCGNILWFGIGVVFATLSKYQMWPVVGIICLFFAVEILKSYRVRGFLILVTLGLMVCYWPLRNFVKFGTPTYPYSTPGMSSTKPEGKHFVETANISDVQLYEGFKGYPRPLLFLMSALEVTRLMPYPHEMQWTYEQWSIDETKNPNYRMGGWSFLTVFMFLFIGIRTWNKRIFPRRIWLPILLAIAVVSILPQSYELRYYLFIPFIGAFMFSEYMGNSAVGDAEKKYLKAVVVLSVLLVLSSRAFLPFNLNTVDDFVTEKERLFWKNSPANSKDNPVCIKDSPARILYWAGRDFNSVWVKKCD